MEPADRGIDVNEVMREIRERVRRRGAQPLVFPEDGGAPQQPAPAFEMSRVRFSAIELREAMRRVNEMPPRPPTLRGRIGGVFVRFVRRVMFWQVEQNRRFQTAAVNALDEQARALETLWTDVQGLASAMGALRGRMAEERSLAQRERERLESLLAEEARSRHDLAEDYRAALHRIEHALLQQDAAKTTQP